MAGVRTTFRSEQEVCSFHYCLKIKNGSHISIGEPPGKINIYMQHHFNWLQKKMIKWCFGFDVVDYSEE